MKHGYSGYCKGACRCKVCKEGQVAYAREYKQRPGVKERQRAYQAEYRERKREEKLAYGREYKLRNAEELRSRERSPEGRLRKRKRENARRARKLNQFIEDVDPRVLWEAHGGCCGICKGFVTLAESHIDHVVPLNLGGLHGYVNCQPAHARCNLSKGARLAA